MARINPLFSVDPNINTFLNTPTSANLITAVTDETGTGNLVFSLSPLLTAASSTSVGLTVRAASGQTENIQVWQSSAPATLARISQTGSIATAANLSVGATGIVNGNQFQVTATSATQIGAVIKAATSQSANLTEWQDSNGNLLARVAESGQIATSGRLTVGSTTVSTLGQVVIPLGLDRVGLVVKATSGQTLNLQEWQDSGGNLKSYITADGSILTSSTLTGSGNLRVGGLSSVGGGLGVIGISNATTVPASSPTGGGILYVDTGALKYRGTSGSAQNLVSADGTINFTGDVNASGYLKSNNSSGDEGGEIFLSKSVTNTTITNGVTIDVYQNKLRFFEQGGTARGYYIDITTGGAGVATNLVGSGSYTLPTASTTVLGGVKLNSDTVQTTAANAVSSTASRTYGIQLDGSGQMVTNVPWTDTVYTLPTASATVLGGIKVGTNLSIDGSGVLSSTDTNTTYTLSSGTNNGTLKLTPSSGVTQDNVAVTGLGTAAYTASTAYAAASHTHAGTDITSGTIGISYIPTGTTGTTVALGNHVHGNITNTGTLSTSVTATNPVKVVITDSGNTVGTLTTTGASGTTFLRGDGTWVTPTGFANPMTTAGDIIYGGASGAPTRLAGSGTNNWVLTYDTSTSAPKWAAVSASFTGGTLTSNLTLVSGATTTYPLTFQSNGTAPNANLGTMDFSSSTGLQFTNNATTGRGSVDVAHIYSIASDGTTYATDSTVSAFPALTNGISLESGVRYEFEALLMLYNFATFFSSGTTSCTLTVGFALPTVTYAHADFNYSVGTTSTFGSATDTLTYNAVTTALGTGVGISTATRSTTGTDSRYAYVRIRGHLKTSASGNFRPTVNYAGTGIGGYGGNIMAGSWMSIKKTPETMGAWT